MRIGLYGKPGQFRAGIHVALAQDITALGRRPFIGWVSGLRLTKTIYIQFHFTHLSEILREREGLRVNRETLRLWLRAEGLGRNRRKKAMHRKKRPHSAKEDMMLFLDGSPHPWLAGVESTLILCTDDATGELFYGLLREQGDPEGCFQVCHEVFQRYGLPLSFYLDKAS